MRKLAFAAVSTLVLAFALALIFPAPRHAIAQGILSYVVGLIGAAAPTSGIQVAGSDGTNLRALKVASDGTVATSSTSVGGLTNNNAAPGATNIGALVCLANNAAPSWTEGNAVFCSVDLVGRQRVVGTTANDTNASANGVETLPGIAKAAPTAITAGRSEKLQLDTATGAQFVGEAATTTNTAVSQGTFTANTALNIKASAGNVYGYNAVNAAASVCWLQFYNTAGTPTCGTSVVWAMPLPVTPGVGFQPVGPIPLGNFATGIGICVSTTPTGATTCPSTANGTVLFK